MKKSQNISKTAKSINAEKKKRQIMYSSPNSIITWISPGNQFNFFSRMIKRSNN